ncbi:hypothetical protein F5050DRAFT_1129186 [Lentinula boryana]|uniref:Uncharacterized protein n=1 Tax=Lentinula boryana TaxID=40481 RepID=A0ABQ8QKG7_9AGAR|nr:hypothetical protein F5050DRAFT_1129186 [Lentinula boryana]
MLLSIFPSLSSSPSRAYAMYLLLVTAAFTVAAKPIPPAIPQNGDHKVVANPASVATPSHGNQRLKIMLGRIAYLGQNHKGKLIRVEPPQGEFRYSETLPFEMQDEFVLFIGIENGFAFNLQETLHEQPSGWELSPPRIMPPSAEYLARLEITVSFDSNERLKEVLDSFRDKAKVLQIAREVLQPGNVIIWNEADYFDVILRYLVKIKAVDPGNNLNRWNILRARIDAATGVDVLDHPLSSTK